MITKLPAVTPVTKAEFELLVKENMKRAYYAALGFLGSHDSAMEISQEAFIRAYKNIDKYDKDKKFFTWYYKILRNLCLNSIRNNKRKKEARFIEVIKEGDFTGNIEEALEMKDTIEKLQEAIAELSPEEREIITLKEFENMNYKEISETLVIPIGSVMLRLFYARKKLAAKLKRKL